MNKILLGQDNVKEEIVDESLEIKCSKKQNNIDGYTLNVKVLKSSDLEILYDIKEEITCDLDTYCFKPYDCPFWEYCVKDLPKPNVFDINNMHIDKSKAAKGLFDFDIN